jgi:DNA-binding CsgD family transcriptional regulator
MEKAIQTFDQEAKQFGISHVYYGFMPTFLYRKFHVDAMVWDTHDPKFMQDYCDLEYGENDWSIKWCHEQTKVKRWHTRDILERLSPEEKATECLAYDYGIYEGLTIPLRGATSLSWGGIGLSAQDASSEEWTGLLGSFQTDMETVSQIFHEYVLSKSLWTDFDLSDREKEVLKWVVCGCNKHQIADRLLISARTAEVHIYRIRQKMKCVNDVQVTAKALMLNLVS